MQRYVHLKHPDEGLTIMGQLNSHAKIIEDEFDVTLEQTEDGIVLSGEEQDLGRAVRVMDHVVDLVRSDLPVTDQLIRYLVDAEVCAPQSQESQFRPGFICHGKDRLFIVRQRVKKADAIAE